MHVEGGENLRRNILGEADLWVVAAELSDCVVFGCAVCEFDKHVKRP